MSLVIRRIGAAGPRHHCRGARLASGGNNDCCGHRRGAYLPESNPTTPSSTPGSPSIANPPSPRPPISTSSPPAERRCPLWPASHFGIKDVLSVQGFPATAGSKVLAGYRPPYNATVIERLNAAGAVLLGKLNCDEFAMGSSNENSAYGPVHNPRALDRVPGGSSGGSAAAVAAGMAVATLGSDTGGSIRQPASFCGVVGVLPTYGRVSRYGLIAFASSLDRIGPLTNTVADAATVLGVIAGHDPLDATSSTKPVPDYAAELAKPSEDSRSACLPNISPKASIPRCAPPSKPPSRSFAPKAPRSAPSRSPTPATPCRLLCARDSRGQLQPRPLRRRPLRLSRTRRQHALRHVPALPRRRLRRRGQAPHSPRHIRLKRGLLRCLLQKSPAGPHARSPATSSRPSAKSTPSSPRSPQPPPSKSAKRPTIP